MSQTPWPYFKRKLRERRTTIELDAEQAAALASEIRFAVREASEPVPRLDELGYRLGLDADFLQLRAGANR